VAPLEGSFSDRHSPLESKRKRFRESYSQEIHQSNGTASYEDFSKYFFFFAALKRELRIYKEKADAYENEDGWLFWRTFYNVLPTWYKVAADVALVMTSSACVERVFSLLNNRFSDQQQRALQDYKECTVRIVYNETFRDKIQYP
jgi:hypothetical protein